MRHITRYESAYSQVPISALSSMTLHYNDWFQLEDSFHTPDRTSYSSRKDSPPPKKRLKTYRASQTHTQTKATLVMSPLRNLSTPDDGHLTHTVKHQKPEVMRYSQTGRCSVAQGFLLDSSSR